MLYQTKFKVKKLQNNFQFVQLFTDLTNGQTAMAHTRTAFRLKQYKTYIIIK